MNNEKILPDSDAAAHYATNIKGWVDRHGRYWGDNENLARRQGSTHVTCAECDHIIPARSWATCETCRKKKKIELYNKKEKQEWDGSTPLYSDALDSYFFDKDELTDYLYDNDCSVESLRLIICEPNYYQALDVDYFCDNLPDDQDPPDELLTAISELNETLKLLPVPSWSPGKCAAIITNAAEPGEVLTGESNESEVHND